MQCMKLNLTPAKFQNFLVFWNISPKITQGKEWWKENEGKKIYSSIPCSIKFLFRFWIMCIYAWGRWYMSRKMHFFVHLDAFLQSVYIFCLCAWISLLQIQPAVQRAGIESWEDGGECSNADVGVFRGTALSSEGAPKGFCCQEEISVWIFI